MPNNADWYPPRIADRAAWHANFAAQANATGTSDGLTAAQVTQIAADSQMVENLINYDQEVDTFAQGFTEYMRIMLSAPLNEPLPTPPAPPPAFSVVLGAAASIEARTRQYAGIIKAAPGYTPTKGELYGIVAPAATGPGTPAVLQATALLNSEVSLSLFKAGYSVLAVDMRRGGGNWTQIGVSQTATFLDTTDAAVAGQPEQREYRVQGMIANQRIGDVSPVVSVVTVP